MANIKDTLNRIYSTGKNIASDIKTKGLDKTIEQALDDPKAYLKSKDYTVGKVNDLVTPAKMATNKEIESVLGKGAVKDIKGAATPTVKATPRAGMGGKVLGGLGVGLEAYNTGKAMADPYADWKTRTLDAAALAGMAGATYLGSLLGRPVLGAVAGEALSAPARNMSSDMRGMNRGLNTASTPMTPEEQAIYDEYIRTGKTLSQQVGSIPVSNTVAPEQSNPQDFPYQTTPSAQPQASSNLSPAPRIQDMNPNPEITDLGVPQTPLQGQATVNVDAQGNPVVVTGAAAPSQGMAYVPYTPTVSYDMTEQEKQILQDAQNAGNQVSSRDILNTLRQSYTDMLQQATTQDPRYQGGLIPAQGYYVDPKAYEGARASDLGRELIAELGGPNYGSRAQRMLDDARVMYEIQMANQAGVPYAEYKAAMLDRQKNAIAIRQKEVEDALTLQAQQTSDMKERLDLLSDIYKSRIEAQREIDKANAAAYGDIQKQHLTNIGNVDVANINRAKDITVEQMGNRSAENVANINAQAAMDRLQRELQDPTTRAQAISRIYSSFGYLDPKLVKAVLPNLPPEIQEMLYGGKLTPDQVNELLGLQNMDMNSETSNFNRFMAKIRGVQANEQ